MNRNTEQHFSQLPSVDIQRSIFNRSSSHKTTFNTGDLIPVYLDEVLPGDTFKMSTSKIVRLQTLLTPIMDNAYLDTYWFFVPNRLVWNHWKEFCGENTAGAWVPETTYSMPKITSPSGGFAVGTIADYMGVPTGVEFDAGDDDPNYDHFPTSLPFRAYALVCNEFFRDENLTDPLNIPLGDSLQIGSNGSSYINDVANGGMPFKVAKYHDYFTSALPSPQKGDQVAVPFPSPVSGDFPVRYDDLGDYEYPEDPETLGNPAFWLCRYKYNSDDRKYHYDDTDWLIGDDNGQYQQIYGWTYNETITDPNASVYKPAHGSGYIQIPSSPSSSFSVNELRLAFQAQKMLERNARGGTRYIEILKSHFGVTSPDARLQRPEYLGGNRVPLAVHQVTNNAQSESDFLGDLGAMSYTADVHADFEKSFTEHGYLMCVCCVRYDHTYSQGLEKLWTRNSFTDFYLPVFANIGEQPVTKDQIYCDGSAPDVFGYQEAWAEYRYKPNRVSSEMRPGITGSLASWHLGDYYTEAPTLSDAWIREDKTNVDRVLAVTSANSNQILADIYFDAIVTRPMPMYSIPGLIDHN